MTVANLTNEAKSIITGNDNIVIVNYFDGIRGGRTLDMTGYTDNVVKAGHPIIVKDGVYKPLPVETTTTGEGSAAVTTTGFASLPTGFSYAGFLVATIPASKPFAAIMTRGTVNPKATPYPLDSILSALKTALPLIDYQED